MPISGCARLTGPTSGVCGARSVASTEMLADVRAHAARMGSRPSTMREYVRESISLGPTSHVPDLERQQPTPHDESPSASAGGVAPPVAGAGTEALGSEDRAGGQPQSDRDAPQTDGPAPWPPHDASDDMTALIGPVMAADFASTDAFSRRAELDERWSTGVSTQQVAQWIEQRAASAPATTFALYANIPWTTVLLCSAEPGNTMYDLETAAFLALPQPTHALALEVDCAAPRAQVELYVLSARQMPSGAARPAPPRVATTVGAQRPHGWRLASAQVQRGFGTRVQLPVLLDDAWVGSDSPAEPDSRGVDLILVVEALDDAGAPLLVPNALSLHTQTTKLPAGAGASGAHRLGPANGIAQMGSYTMHLHELFGFRSRAGAVADGDTTHDGSAPDSGLLDADPRDGTECVICMTMPPSTLIVPCTHALCLECAVRMRESIEKAQQADQRHGRAPRMKYVCPICRGPIKSMLALSKNESQ